jgi:hypothetical protein
MLILFCYVGPCHHGTARPRTVDGREHLQAWTVARIHMLVYPKVSGLAAWSENNKWYSSVPIDPVVSLFYESV